MPHRGISTIAMSDCIHSEMAMAVRAESCGLGICCSLGVTLSRCHSFIERTMKRWALAVRSTCKAPVAPGGCFSMCFGSGANLRKQRASRLASMG